jgi:folate-binding Fe-S cluster repair protein YgfZ
VPALVLPDRTLVHVDGAEAEHFLQNLITANVETIEPGQAQPAALLTPQGKILFDFLVSRAPGGGYFLDIAAELAGNFPQAPDALQAAADVTLKQAARNCR